MTRQLDPFELEQAEARLAEQERELEAQQRERAQERALLAEQRQAAIARVEKLKSEREAAGAEFVRRADTLMKKKLPDATSWYGLGQELRQAVRDLYSTVEVKDGTPAERREAENFARIVIQGHPTCLLFEHLKILLVRDFPSVPSN